MTWRPGKSPGMTHANVPPHPRGRDKLLQRPALDSYTADDFESLFDHITDYVAARWPNEDDRPKTIDALRKALRRDMLDRLRETEVMQ